MNRPVWVAGLVCAVAALGPTGSICAPVDDAVSELQRDWDVIRYQTPQADREKRFEVLLAKAHQASSHFAGRAEPLVWEGIIVSSLAREKGGWRGLGLARQARSIYEQAIRIDPQVLDGGALNSLAVLYYTAPGWPLGFGDKAKAGALLQQALEVSPQGIDANYAYAEYLVTTGHADDAVPYLERALQAPPRPGRQIADTGRREEARALLGRLRSR